MCNVLKFHYVSVIRAAGKIAEQHQHVKWQQLHTKAEEEGEEESLYLQQVTADRGEDEAGDNHTVRKKQRGSYIYAALATHPCTSFNISGQWDVQLFLP